MENLKFVEMLKGYFVKKFSIKLRRQFYIIVKHNPENNTYHILFNNTYNDMSQNATFAEVIIDRKDNIKIITDEEEYTFNRYD